MLRQQQLHGQTNQQLHKQRAKLEEHIQRAARNYQGLQRIPHGNGPRLYEQHKQLYLNILKGLFQDQSKIDNELHQREVQQRLGELTFAE